MHANRMNEELPDAARPAGRRTIPRTAGALMAALTTVAVATGCGAGDAGGAGEASSPAPAASGSSAAATAHNQADVTFAQGMIPHHEQAVHMAELAEGRAGDPEVTALAAKIKAAQAPEIQQMTTWLTEWGAAVPSPPATADNPHGGMHGGDDGMPGMMSEQDMAALAAGKGGDFDRMFLEMMIRHHEGAVQMAESEEREGQHPGAKALAAQIKADQTAEIALMRDLLKRK